MRILGIESSCDETAAAVVTSDRQILSNIVYSQIDCHRPYGGVVPEIAARAHVEVIDEVIDRALTEAGMTLAEIDLIAATGGPGLIGGVMVGVMAAKALSAVTGIPYYAVNHLEGHALTVRLTDDVAFPYLLLLISGGHCQWLAVAGPGQYHLLGATLDDALGEAFDKTAKMLGLPYPGGPQVERLAAGGNPNAYPFPRPLFGQAGCDFSFSGLKTAVLQTVEKLRLADTLSDRQTADLCASFQQAAVDCLTDRLNHAAHLYARAGYTKRTLVVAGGVAANGAIKHRLTSWCAANDYRLVAPPPGLCTDNAVMIAWAGYELSLHRAPDGPDFEPRARWPLSA